MAVSNVVFQTGANYAEGQAILSPLIQEIANQSEAQVGLESQAEKFGFVMGDALTPKGEITAMVGPEPLRKIDEDGIAPLVTLMQGYSKGYAMDTYAIKHKITKVFMEWLKKGSSMVGVDSSVAAELGKFKEAIQNMVYGSELTMNELITRTFTDGFSVTAAYGAGAPSPDGVALFSASHVVKKTGATFSNLISAGSFLTAVTLEAAIQSYKVNVKTPNGYRMKTPDIFDLLVPRALETTARKILNSNGDQAGVFAGTGSNANLLNVFSFQGSKVRLTVLDMVGEIGMDGSTIGGANADAMWFLMNKEYALKYKAFRIFRLWDNEITMYTNDETKSMFTDISMHVGVEHFNCEAVMGFA
jgi:hypothetical protein